MESYEIYILVLAITVFTIFTALFTVMISYITRNAIKLIRYGDDDEIIVKKRKYIEKKPSKPSKLERGVSLLLSVFVVAIFIFALCISCTDSKFESGLSSVKIVKSDSMAKKNEKNLYLFENNLNDQFNMFDVVITKPLPKEDELKLYDIVVYERDDMLIIHRIVGIEEPNEKHSERYFMLQGDAVSRHDIYPVLYSQMQAKYDGMRIPFVGSIIMFIQSPAGWLCFILILFAILATPIVENKLLEEMRKRLLLLDSMPAPEPAEAETEPEIKPEDEAVETMADIAPYNPDAIRITSVMEERTDSAAKRYDDYIKFIVSDVQKNGGETKLFIKEDEPPKKHLLQRLKILLKIKR